MHYINILISHSTIISLWQSDVNNRQLHPQEISLAKQLAEKSGGRFSEEKIADAMRASGNGAFGESVTTGMVVPLTKDTPAGALYDTAGMRLVNDGAGNAYMIQALPSQVDPALAAYVTANTGGASSPYGWSWATPGTSAPSAPANSPASGEGSPRYFPCATANCLFYGANRNPTNPQNMAEDKNFNTKLAAAGIIAGVPVAFAAGAPTLIAMGTAAQTVPLVGGAAGVAGGKWALTVGVGATFGAFGNYAIDADSSPASMAVGAAAGAVGGIAKLGLNATYGLANQWVPTTVANVGTAIGSKATGGGVKAGLNQTGDTTSGMSWWTSPITPCGPIIPRSPCK